jgi:hypothetical protein
VTDDFGHEIERDPTRLETFKDYVRNIATWLAAGPSAGRAREVSDGASV